MKRFVQSRCSVKGCQNTNVTNRMFSFPQNRNLSLEWISICGNEELFDCSAEVLQKKYKVCNKHFEVGKFRRVLPKNTIPTIDLPEPVIIPCSLDTEIDYTPVTPSGSINLTSDFSSVPLKLSYSNITSLIDVTLNQSKETIVKEKEINVDVNKDIAFLSGDFPTVSHNVSNSIESINSFANSDVEHFADDACQMDVNNENSTTPLKQSRNNSKISPVVKQESIHHADSECKENIKIIRRKTKSFESFNPADNSIFIEDITIKEEFTEDTMKFHDYCFPDINLICRLCGIVQDDDDLLTNIFDEKTHIYQLIEKCFPDLKIIREEHLPENACRGCCKFLKYVSSFLNAVKRADKNIKNMYGLHGKEEELVLAGNQTGLVSVPKHNGNDRCDHFQDNNNQLTVKFVIERNKNNHQFVCPFCVKISKTKGQMMSHITLGHINENKLNEKVIRKGIRKKVIKNVNKVKELSNVNKMNVSILNVSSQDLEINEKTSLNLSAVTNDSIIIENIVMDKDSCDNNPMQFQEDFISYSNMLEGPTDPCELNTQEYHPNDVDKFMEENYNYENLYEGNLTEQDVKVEPANYPCEKCSKIFSSLSLKERHERKVHGKLAKCFSCMICLEAFSNVIQLTHHSSSIHNYNLIGTEAKKVSVKYLYCCEFCCRLYTRFPDILIHKTECSSALNDKYTCFCSESIQHFNDFQKHWTSHDVNNPFLERPLCRILYICEYCYKKHEEFSKIIYHIKSKHSMQVAKNEIQRVLGGDSMSS